MSGRPGYDELVEARGREIAKRIIDSAEAYSDNAHRPWDEALRWAIAQHDQPADPGTVRQQQENTRLYDDLVDRRGADSRPILYLATELGRDVFEYPARLARAETIYDAEPPHARPGASMREQLDWATSAAQAARNSSN